jgi:DNA anti-recombination protein RmuC
MSRRPFRRSRTTAQEGDGEAGTDEQIDHEESLAHQLDAELERAREELKRLSADTLQVARQFEGEAAARAEAEAAVERLRRENEQLLAEIDELRARLARKAGAEPA